MRRSILADSAEGEAVGGLVSPLGVILKKAWWECKSPVVAASLSSRHSRFFVGVGDGPRSKPPMNDPHVRQHHSAIAGYVAAITIELVAGRSLANVIETGQESANHIQRAIATVPVSLPVPVYYLGQPLVFSPATNSEARSYARMWVYTRLSSSRSAWA